MPLLLTYNINSTKQLQLEMLCATLNIPIRVVKSTEWNIPIELLASQPMVPPSTPSTISDEMLVFCHLTQDTLNSLLEAMQQQHISIQLKAIMTPTNSKWNSIELHQHLHEHIK